MTCPSTAPIRVLYLGEQPRETGPALSALAEAGEFVVRRPDASDGLPSFDGSGVDCLLVDGRAVGELERVRRECPERPVVVVVDDGADVPTDEHGSVLATEYIRRRDAATGGLLATRLRTAVGSAGRDGGTRQRILRELHDVATELPTYDSVEAVCERTVEAAETVLEFDNCVVMLAEEDRMELVALSDEFPGRDFDALPVDDSFAGYSYRTGESALVDDITTDPIANPQGGYKSGISIPLGDHGTCQMISERAGAFDEGDMELGELLVAHTQAALDRLTRETELREQNERLEQFASVLTHDLRNPLNVAHGRIELARETGDSEQLDVALDALERMEALTDDLLTLARDGEGMGTTQAVSLERLARSCWRTIDTGTATMETGPDASLRADRSRLRQLLENLIRNAVDHAGDGVTVEVGALDDGFYVADDGPGIAPDERAHVFEVGHSTDRDGTGFGLAIVKDVVDAHGWEVDVRESDAGGACFAVTGVESAE